MLKQYAPNEFLARLAERRTTFYPEIEARVREILADVQARGDAALHDLTRQFDQVDLRECGFAVAPGEWQAGVDGTLADLLAALEQAAANIRAFHEPQVPHSWFQTRPDGSVLGQQVSAVERVGIYIPGGSAPLYSCLLMTAIPARVAGVKEIILCTPPGRDGQLHPAMLAAARVAGVDRIFKVGGAQAVGAMAYGTASIPRVEKIVGPGNYYVTMAKKLVFGPVGIDMLAGPTEVVCIDDGSAPADWLAADLCSQAEHPNGMCILITTAGAARVAEIDQAITRQVARLPRGETIAQSFRELGAALLAANLDEAAELSNAVAPEHLELAVHEPWGLLPAIRHAGSIFMGHWTPEPMGDYICGPSNVIPTEGTPRYASPVNVETFIKRSAVVAYSKRAFLQEAPQARLMAHGEGLQAHANSLEVRLNDTQGRG